MMNADQHWMDMVAGIEAGFLTEIVNQNNLEDNSKELEYYWVGIAGSKIIDSFNLMTISR